MTGNNSTWSLPTTHGSGCSFNIQHRTDGGEVRVLDAGCFANPLLAVHSFDSGLSPALCARLIRAAEKVGTWDEKSAMRSVKTYDMSLQLIAKHLGPNDLAALERFIGETLSKFIMEHMLLRRPAIDGAEMVIDGVPVHAPGSYSYDQVVRLKGTPFIIKYDAEHGASALKRHKDNSDVSFILTLSDSTDYDGGGTLFDALGSQNVLRPPAGHALVFGGQLVHSAAPITRGKRYVLSGFTNFAEDYLLQLKRRGTLDTMPYLH